MKINMQDYMSNPKVGKVIDSWHLIGDYQMHLIKGTLLREDLQQPHEPWEPFTEDELVKYWLQVIETKERIHDRTDEFVEDKAILMAYRPSFA